MLLKFLMYWHRILKKSFRVGCLKALKHEAMEDYEKAEEIYQSLREFNPTFSFPYTRLVAIAKEKNDVVQAINLLNEYLKIFMAETDAWVELGELYLSIKEYQNALFCFEEVILAEPDNFHYHVKYADIRFTIGGSENLNLAKQHYAHSIELNNENNLRGLYGLCLTIFALSKQKGSKITKEDVALFNLASDLLKKNYKDNQNFDIIEGTLEMLKL